MISPKRVHRIWKEEGLQFPRRETRQQRYGEPQGVKRRAKYPNHVWSYDFLTMRTKRGHQVRNQTVIDEYTRECLALFAAGSIPATEVLHLLNWLFPVRATPEHLRSDNGPEFIAEAVKDWLERQEYTTLFITPGSPWKNPFVESFVGKLRAECLERYAFDCVEEVQQVLDHWLEEYNYSRPHSSLGYLTLAEFAAQAQSELESTQETLRL